MNLPYSEKLNIAALSRLFDNKSECYKLFWFQVIVRKVCADETELFYEALIDEMIADAWYMVTEYHLNLGPRDTLEKVVDHIYKTTGMLPSVKRQDILKWLERCDDPVVIKCKRDLTLNVPYRLQAPFYAGFRTETWNCGTKELAMRINQQRRLMYYFDSITGLQTRIFIDPDWSVYLKENQEILRGWIQYNMILYLQRRNPNVPGISDKLYPPQERKLEKVKSIGRYCLRLILSMRFMEARKLPEIISQLIILFHGLMLHMMSSGIFIRQPDRSTAAKATTCRIGIIISHCWLTLNIIPIQ